MQPTFFLSTTLSDEQPEVKLTIAERWEKLLKETHDKVKRERIQNENIIEKRPPYQEAFFNQLIDFQKEIEWTKNHIVWAFNLPTSYTAPGQEHIEFEETKVRIPIDVKKINLITTYSQEQLEDVVDGWIKYMEKRMKTLKDKVNRQKRL